MLANLYIEFFEVSSQIRDLVIERDRKRHTWGPGESKAHGAIIAKHTQRRNALYREITAARNTPLRVLTITDAQHGQLSDCAYLDLS